MIGSNPNEPNECNEVRPGTLGYQSCWLPKGHWGPHQSQDVKTWTAETPNRVQPERDGQIVARRVAGQELFVDARIADRIIDAYLNPDAAQAELEKNV